MFWWWTIRKLASPQTRVAAADRLIAARAAGPLVSRLGNTDQAFVEEVERVLLRIGPPAVEPLLAALRRSPSTLQRARATDLLGRIADARATDPLIVALRDAELQVRMSAARALGAIASPVALTALVTALPDGENYEREEKRKILRGVASATPDLLHPLLQSKEDAVRARAAEMLGHSNHPASAPALAPLLLDPYYGAWSAAVKGLANWGAASVPHLLDAIPRAGERVTDEILSSVAKIGDRAAVEPLLALLPAASSRLRSRIVYTLGRLRDPRAAPALLALLESDDATVCNAIGALGEVGDPRATPALIGLLRDAALQHYRERAAHALGRMADPAAVEALAGALGDPAEQVRRAAADALGRIADPRAVNSLLTKWQERQDEVRPAYAEALGKIGDVRAVEALIDGLREDDYHVRLHSVRALGVLRDKRAVTPLMDLIHREQYFRDDIAEALAAIGDPQAIPALEQTLTKGMGQEATRKTEAALLRLREAGFATSAVGPGEETVVFPKFDTGVNILKFPRGFERQFERHWRLVAELQRGGTLPELAAHRAIPKTDLPALIILTGPPAAIGALGKVYFTKIAEEFVRRECGGDWQAINAASSLSNVADPGATVDIHAFNEFARQISPANYTMAALGERIHSEDRRLERQDEPQGVRPQAGGRAASGNLTCPQCRTVYNRREVIRQLRQASPFLFDSATWTTKFRCVRCSEVLIISGSATE